MKRFAQPLNQAGNGNLVAHLGHLACAAVADTAANAGIGLDHRLCLFKGLDIAATHHRQNAVLRARLPTRDRRIHKRNAAFACLSI